MALYKLAVEDGNVLRIGFGDPAQNDAIVKEVSTTLVAMVEAGQLPGGGLLKVNGPASLPVAAVVVHAVAHLYAAVAIYDPKLSKYVVAISHSNLFKVGDLID